MDRSWLDPEAAWALKLARAQVHLASLREQVEEFRRRDPYAVTPEPTEIADRVAYKLHIYETVPPMISTTLGDIVHNLRSALDNLAYEIAGSHLTQSLNKNEELAAAFPVCKTPDAFENFFDKERPIRATMYGPDERAAFRAVQPFFTLEQALSHGFAATHTYEDEFRWHALARLSSVSNLDKHRRLAVMSWAPDMIYWGSDGPTKRRWIGARRHGRLSDGEILGHMIGSDPGMGDLTFEEFNLVLEDDPAHDPADSLGGTEDVVSTLGSWHGKVRYAISEVVRRLPPRSAV